MEDKIKIFLIGLLIIAAGVAISFFAKKGLDKQKNPTEVNSYLGDKDSSEWVTITVDQASTEVLTVQHLNWFVIPWGKDHFFFAANKDGVVVTVKADDDWYEENFDENGNSKNEGGVTIVGKVYSFSSEYDSDIREKIDSQAEKIVLDKSFSTTVYIDSEESKLLNWVFLVFGVIVAIGGVGFTIYFLKG